jgi:putative Ca2+/H+ antiporter (TMEM165/GDT1 family)
MAVDIALESDDPSAPKSLDQAFLMSFLMIMVSEIGDKTFLIAAIMSMRHSRLLIFSAALGALFVMTVLSVGIGYEVPNVLPEHIIRLIASFSFLFFGAKTLYEGYHMSEQQGAEEFMEVEAELEAKDKGVRDLEVGGDERDDDLPPTEKWKKTLSHVLSPVFLQTFVLTFIAEWGDRSQFATIALAASQVSN